MMLEAGKKNFPMQQQQHMHFGYVKHDDLFDRDEDEETFSDEDYEDNSDYEDSELEAAAQRKQLKRELIKMCF